VSKQEKDYFCFDYDKDFKGQKYRVVFRDTLTGKITRIEEARGTLLYVGGGRSKTKTRLLEFDRNGKVILKRKSHTQNFGRFGRERKYRLVEHLPSGQKKVTLRKGTLRNPHKLERIRFKGNKFKRSQD
jgi:hypothetical protein